MVNTREDLVDTLHPQGAAAPVEWLIAPRQVAYGEALAGMESQVQAIAEGRGAERVWLLEHPPLYTAGTSARGRGVIDARFPVFEAGRGGQMTYHGPGQRVAYVMLDLNRRKRDLRVFVAALEAWIIATLAAFNIRGERREDRVGVWVRRPDKGQGYEDKIAAIGIRVRRWVTLHGISLNVEPELDHFGGIVACGIEDPRYGVTSLVDLGLPVTMEEVDMVLKKTFIAQFGPVAGSE
ncbi:lipoyl(octanoyl) transferase LipB [Phreatobacter sp. AB_2022a]|uniref:lipoyl(octanoyl) transferase LipB n=1 Tax=Phreatobacter sp. AB_2022a TaxID=3003134 RepID=UPI00056E0F85|nr:lipoyl(octanoyl) transferase LipB [Phreatobacter sp. AB_2022a]CEJ12664.1 Octanoyltransferase [bacterium YEK0313]